MLRKLSLLAGLVLLTSLTVNAQGFSDKVELFGGYSYLRTTSPSFNLNGWELSGQYKVTDWLGGVADFDGHYGSPNGFSSSLHTFLFGPQVSWPARVSPFAHALLGGAHISSAASLTRRLRWESAEELTLGWCMAFTGESSRAITFPRSLVAPAKITYDSRRESCSGSRHEIHSARPERLAFQ